MPKLATTSADQPDDAPATPHEPTAASPGRPDADAPTSAPVSAPATTSTGRAPESDPGSIRGATASAGAPETGSLERMARLRQRVRQDGVETEVAARELGVDPIIAQLWLRLPDDLWPVGRSAGARSAAPATATPPPPPPSIPVGGLRRVLTCRVPAPAIDRLRAADGTVVEAAAQALEAGLAQPRPGVAPGGWRFPRRPLAVPLAAETYRAVLQLAEEAFRGDPRDAAGWLIARGAGLAFPLPTAEELAGTGRSLETPVTERPASAPVRFIVPPRRRPEARAPLPADDSAPSGEELRRRRDATGLSQRDLAAASGLSRGLVAEIERGRRRHVLTRLRLSETLAAVERTKAARETPAPGAASQ